MRLDSVEGMRGGVILVACLLTACGGSGVDVEIFAPEGVELDRVQLWVAYDDCGDCPNGIAWTASGDRASGSIHFLRDEALVSAEPHGDAWVLHLEADASEREPRWIAVAGYRGDQVAAIRVLRDLYIPSTTPAIWRIQLHEAQPASADVTSPPGDAARDHRALAWARPPSAASAEPTGCLVYQKWDGESWETEYFVPPSDPDCDGFPPEKECSEYWFDYEPLGRCVTDAGPIVPEACMAGMSPCADGVTSDRTCSVETSQTQAPPTCLPDAVCAECADEIPADTCVGDAIEAAIANDSTLHFHCDFDATSEGTPCLEQKMLLKAPMLQASCGSGALHDLDRPFTDPRNALVYGVDAAQVTFTLTPGSVTCQYVVTWTGGSNDTFANGITFLLEVPYSNGMRALYPIQVKPTNEPITCDPVPLPRTCEPGGPLDDGVVLCAAH